MGLTLQHPLGSWKVEHDPRWIWANIQCSDSTYVVKGINPTDAETIVRACNAHNRLIEILRECMGCMSSLRDFVAESDAHRMVGAMSAIYAADDAYDTAHAFLKQVQP